MKMHKQLKSMYESIAKENPQYNPNFCGDSDYDKDMIVNDAQSGDHFIGILKGCGAGSYLNRIAVEPGMHNHANYTVKEAHADSRFFHLHFTGIDEGEIKEVSREKALELSVAYKENPYRTPRRVTLESIISDKLGVKGVTGTRFFSEFSLEKGEITAFKISADTQGSGLLHMARSKLSKVREGERCKVSESYSVPMSYEKWTEAMKEPEYFKVKITTPPYAEVSPISKRVFDNTVKKSHTLNADHEAGLAL